MTKAALLTMWFTATRGPRKALHAWLDKHVPLGVVTPPNGAVMDGYNIVGAGVYVPPGNMLEIKNCSIQGRWNDPPKRRRR